MLATFALLGSLLTFPVQDTNKVNFAHNFAKGQTLAYELKFDGHGVQGDMEIDAAFSILFGDKADKGTNVTITPKSIKMKGGGQDIDQPSNGDTKYILDEHGMPNTVSMDGSEGIIVIPLVLSYLPNKELAVGETFDIDWKKDTTSFKGTGKYEGTDKVDEKSFPKITIKAKLNPGGQGDGDIEYAVYFDKEAGHIALLKGKVQVENQEFNFVLTKK